MRSLQNIDSSELKQVEIIDRISKCLGRGLPSPHSGLKMVVIIPAKNEEDQILSTLQSFSKQVHQDGFFDKEKFEILVLCHNCSDNTKKKCELFFASHPDLFGHVLYLHSRIANTVGAARRILMNIAYDRLPDDRGLIISTDADTLPDKKWLYHLEKYIEQETSLVCGIILSNVLGLQDQAMKYLLAKDEYLLLKSNLESKLLPDANDPWPRHNYHWGPNMAIKKAVYGAIGGIRPLHFLEDVDLYNRVKSEGYLVRHCLKSKVFTSTRTDSRCQEGFGAELRVWTDWEGVAYNVEGLEKLLSRYEIYGLIKEYYKSTSTKLLSQIATLAQIDKHELQRMFNTSERAEAMIIKMEEHLNKSEKWNSLYPNKGVIEVCKELKNYFTQNAIPHSSVSSITQAHNDHL